MEGLIKITEFAFIRGKDPLMWDVGREPGQTKTYPFRFTILLPPQLFALLQSHFLRVYVLLTHFSQGI